MGRTAALAPVDVISTVSRSAETLTEIVTSQLEFPYSNKKFDVCSRSDAQRHGEVAALTS